MHMASKQHCITVDDVASTLIQHCFDGVCLLGQFSKRGESHDSVTHLVNKYAAQMRYVSI